MEHMSKKELLDELHRTAIELFHEARLSSNRVSVVAKHGILDETKGLLFRSGYYDDKDNVVINVRDDEEMSLKKRISN